VGNPSLPIILSLPDMGAGKTIQSGHVRGFNQRHKTWSEGLLGAFLGLIFLFGLNACAAQSVGQVMIQVNVQADGKTSKITVPVGTTAQGAYIAAGLSLGSLDRSDPPLSTVLADHATLHLIRVHEEFENVEEAIPFEHQVVHNESLPQGQTLLIQPGTNGIQETTYRHLYEDGIEVSKSVVKSVIIKEATPEIVMVGVQAPFTAFAIPGRLVYLTGGNAWVMDGSTGNRIPVVTSGDLDGRVFSLSPDGAWLLYTRKISGSPQDTINTLWVSKIADRPMPPIDLKVKNIVNYAGWVPGSPQTIAYSTVEARNTAPGWQANNDLQFLSFTASGEIIRRKQLIAPNSGGVYGWWGTYFAWSQDGTKLAYSRPDGIGLVDLKTGDLQPLLNITPYQTRADWAWVPPIAWSPDSEFVYSIAHPPAPGINDPETSPLFDLIVLSLPKVSLIPLAVQTGMFAAPRPSPYQGSSGWQVAFLQAVFPDQSDSSRYRLMVMDRDGSNRRSIFPQEGLPGLDPQQIVWSPAEDDPNKAMIAVIYQGNIWLISSKNGSAQQITGDGLTSNIDWK
jgi:hypothetical protein